MRKYVGFFAIFFAVCATAQTLPQDEKVRLVTSDFQTISRVAALARDINNERQVILAIIDSDVELLRDKRPDDTYRWASLQREEGGRVKDEKAVERVQSEKELKEITLSAPHAYRVEVRLPTKRSLVSANNRVYVRNIIVDSLGFDGKMAHHDIPVNVWVNPGDTTGVALPEIGKNVRATVELGVESGEKKAVAEASLLEAKLVDDPTSPYFPVVRRLLQIREVAAANEVSRGQLKTVADEALLAMPGELEKRNAEIAAAAQRRTEATGTVMAGDASPDVVAAMQEITRLLGGTLQDQTDARAKLQALIDKLQPKPETTTPH
ncbi:MAG TPA: hypothetical protein VLV78_23700 [Thermoanaerobaculia bacterium]|nr:hypothetical protein [Thermoanaerobaculia bacterium]